MSAIQELNDLAINYVSSHPELLAKAKELMTIEWRTYKVPNVAHLTVIRSAYSEETVLIDVAVSDSFAKQLEEEYVEGFNKELPEEG